MTKNSYLSVYYEDGIYHEVESICQKSSALLIIDLQNTYANLGQTENTSRFKDFAKRLEGWNSTLLYKDDYDNQIIESVIPKSEEIVLTKTTDSALAGTNLIIFL